MNLTRKVWNIGKGFLPFGLSVMLFVNSCEEPIKKAIWSGEINGKKVDYIIEENDSLLDPHNNVYVRFLNEKGNLVEMYDNNSSGEIIDSVFDYVRVFSGQESEGNFREYRCYCFKQEDETQFVNGVIDDEIEKAIFEESQERLKQYDTEYHQIREVIKKKIKTDQSML